MKFPLPHVSEEDRGLLRDLRSKRKYEAKKASHRQIQKKDGESYCMVTITALCGAIITISTVIFTVMEIVKNKNTRITAYPMDYHGNDMNIVQHDNNLYPRVSLDEVRAEIERARAKEIVETKEETEKALTAQQSIISPDFPSDSDPNKVHDIISTFFNNTEFYRRFRSEGDTEWTASLSSSIAIYNDSLYSKLPICLQMINRQNGYGFRIWRDAQIHYMAEMMSCTVALHWGWIDMCPIPANQENDLYNIFEVLFYNNYNFAASHKRYNSMSSTERYPPLHSFNAALAGRGHAMYDRNGIFINGSMDYIDYVNKNILPEKALNSIPDKAIKYDRNLNIVSEGAMIDADIDKSFAELIGWYGGMDIVSVLKYYGLMVQHLRYKYRKVIVDYVENNWKDTFVISYHIQMGNKGDNFGNFGESIIGTLKWLLSNESIVNIEQNIVLYISTDCGDGDALTGFISLVKDKVKEIKSDINVLLRDEERVDFGKGQHMDTKWKMESIQKCVESFSNVQIDAELLGLTDILVLPTVKNNYKSTFTRLSRALIMKRHKTMCIAKQTGQYLCKNFDTKQSATINV